MAASDQSWNLSKIPPAIRALAEQSALRAGVPIGEWLSLVVHDQSEFEQQERLARRRAALEERTKSLDRQVTIVAAPQTADTKGSIEAPSQPSAQQRNVEIIGISGSPLLGKKFPGIRLAEGETPADYPETAHGAPAPASESPPKPGPPIEIPVGLTAVYRLLPAPIPAPVMLDTGRLRPNRFQAGDDGQNHDPTLVSAMRGGAESPALLVRKADDDEGYEIVSGIGLWRAAQTARRSSLPAIVCDLDDLETVKLVLVDTIAERRISPYEEAESYRWLLRRANLSEDDLMEITAHTRGDIRERLALLALPQRIQDEIRDGRIDLDHARPLFDAAVPETAFEIIDDFTLSPDDGERLVRLLNRTISSDNEEIEPIEQGLGKLLGAAVTIERSADGAATALTCRHDGLDRGKRYPLSGEARK